VALTQFQSDDLNFQLMQNSWAAQLNPLLLDPLNQNVFLPNIVLTSGDNTINHKLGRALQGWFIVRQNAAASLFDKQSTNSMPQLTLVLNTSADVTISLIVF
jgi:hypothetical protein